MHKINVAIILAAGRGERMMPLTKTTPKPLLEIAGKPMIWHAIKQLSDYGIKKLIINSFYLANQFDEFLIKYASDFAIPEIIISRETEKLETGGGVVYALPVLGDQPFFAINGDLLWRGESFLRELADHYLQNPHKIMLLLTKKDNLFGYEGVGDFGIENGQLSRNNREFVFSGMQIIDPSIFKQTLPPTPFSLNIFYKPEVAGYMIKDGEFFHIGTPKTLELVNDIYCN